VLDEAKLWGASFLEGVALDIAVLLYIEHHCTGGNSISRLRSHPTEKIYF